MTSIHERAPGEPSFRNLFLAIGLIWLCLFVITLTGYPDLVDNELRVGGYVLDAVQNGHWFVQRDITGDVASKPPMLTWIASVVTLACGRINRFAIYLPSALATLGVAWTILLIGKKQFGWLAGFLGALAYLLSPMADNQVMTARYDGLFALPVTLGAMAAFRSWNTGRGWTWFWLACALATLVKGPLGLLLASCGLFAAFWEWRSGSPARLRGNHLTGVIIYFAICGGWFALAYWQMGQPLIDKMIGRELIGHTLNESRGGIGSYFEPLVNVLSHFLPWSLVGVFGLWRVFKSPATKTETRRFERFLFCWFFAGLIVFALAPHQRGRLIFPLIPATALLAGREMAQWLANVRVEKVLRLSAALSVFVLIFFGVYHHVLLKKHNHMIETLALKSVADKVRTEVGEEFPLTHVDSPFAIQFYLNTYHPWISRTQAVELLRGDAAVFLVVCDTNKLEECFGTNAPVVFVLLTQNAYRETVRIISNHPRLEWTEHMAAMIGPLSLRMGGVKILQARGNEFVLERTGNGEHVFTATNISDAPVLVRMKFKDGAAGFDERKLSPGESWKN